MYRIVFVALLAVMVAAHADDESNSKLFDIHSRLAAKGSAEAQFKLGEMYEEGRGIERDLVKAREWYQQAANQGHDEAKKRLATLGSRQSADDMARLEREAQQAQQRADEERRAAQAQKRAEEERQAAAERRRIEEERERQTQQRAEEERRAAQAQKRAEEERTRQAALLKRQEEERARAAAAQPPAPIINAPAKPSASSDGEKSFETDPCKGAAARFLSTCH